MAKAITNVALSLVSLVTLSAISSASHAAMEAVTRPLSVNASGAFEMGITQNGEPLTLNLRPSSVIGETKLVDQYGRALQKRFHSYSGAVEGEPSSWARINLHGDTLSGVISRQGNRYQLEGSATRQFDLKPLADSGTHSLYEHAKDLRQTRSVSSQTTVATLSAATPAVTHVVNMAVAVDSQYNALHNGSGVEKALSIINSVDGIFREEFGIALQVATVLNVSDRNNDPFDFGNVSIETMLRGLRDYRMQSSQFNDVSLVHLFTGNENTDAPVGLAWIDTACRTDGYDVGLSTPYRHDILLAAHEIAHNLGAKHDDETACSAENDKVMWPYISSQTSQNFSSCTRNSVRQSLQNSCHAKTIDLQVSLLVDEQTYSATVRNNDIEQSSTSSTLTIALPENTVATTLSGDCSTPDNLVQCYFGTLLPGAESEVRLSIENFNGQTEQELVAEINSDDILDLTRANNVASIYKLGDTVALNNVGSNSEPVVQVSSGGNSGFEGGAGTVGTWLTALALLPAFRRGFTTLIG